MTDETGSPAGSEAIFATELPADAPETFSSTREAAEYFTTLKAKKASEPAESAEPATADEPELPDEGNADAEKPPGEDTEDAKPEGEDLPPLEPPRSWTKAEKERFQSLPRETQEYLSTREQEREREFRRSQNEIADQRKAVQAEREAADKARQQYESQLPVLKQALLRSQSESFSDIKTWDDVKALQNNDPFRYQAWDVHQKELAIVDAQAREAEARQSQEKQTKRSQYEAEQNALLKEMLPDMADPKKASELRESAITLLDEGYGLKVATLSRWMQDDTGHEILANAGIQKLIADGLKLRDIQNAKTAVATKPLPPVQRPGTSRPSGQGASSERIQALNRKPELTVKEATELYMLQQGARRAS